MGSRLNKAGGFKFILGSGLNRVNEEENKALIEIYLLSNILPQAIQGDLTGENYEYFVAELQADFSRAVGILRDRATGKDVDDVDTTQTLVVAKKVLAVVDAYFASNPNALKGPQTRAHHLFFNSAIVINAVWEIQTENPRVFAKYLFSGSMKRVSVDGRYLKRRGEPSHVHEIRSLKNDRDRLFDTINRQYDEIHHLRSEVEAKDNLSDMLDISRIDEKIAQTQVKDLKRQVREKGIQIYQQREMYEGKLKGVNMDNIRLARKVGKFKGKAMRAEQEKEELKQEVEELKQQLKNLNAS
jgi:hypothetical protein